MESEVCDKEGIFEFSSDKNRQLTIRTSSGVS